MWDYFTHLLPPNRRETSVKRKKKRISHSLFSVLYILPLTPLLSLRIHLLTQSWESQTTLRMFISPGTTLVSHFFFNSHTLATEVQTHCAQMHNMSLVPIGVINVQRNLPER